MCTDNTERSCCLLTLCETESILCAEMEHVCQYDAPWLSFVYSFIKRDNVLNSEKYYVRTNHLMIFTLPTESISISSQLQTSEYKSSLPPSS